MPRLIFEIKFQSNYHIGAGHGKGFAVDSALMREADGTLVLRGSGLAGLLRDGAYRLLRLPPLAKHPTYESLARLFGDPAQAKRWMISSAYSLEKQPRDPQIVQRVRIDPRTRRAEPRKLFSQEEGVEQIFCFTIACNHTDNSVLDEAALLVASARNVRQLGRSRRRGMGECVIHLIDVIGVDGIQRSAGQSWEEWFLARFEEKWLEGSPSPVIRTEIKVDIPSLNIPEDTTKVLVRVIIRLDEPVLIAQRASAGNQFDTCQLIPGSVMLGALAGQAAEHCDLSNPAIYRDFVTLFLRGGVLFPMLYPAYCYSNNLYPAIPAPLSLLTCSSVPFQGENEGHGTYPAWEHDRCPKCDNWLEPVGEFIVLKRDPCTYAPLRSSELHIRINEESQRVTRGELYGYTALSAGQYFAGELLCASNAVWQRLQEMTDITAQEPLTLRLGKARRRGYGQVTAWLEQRNEPAQIWTQWLLERRVTDPVQPITLTLLTDTIVANSWGQHAAGFEGWLEPVLNLGELKIQDVYARTRAVDGFNATLGLPRWRDMALVAGSSVRFTIDTPLDGCLARMREIEAGGIGLRRSEGFGRVAFNHPIYKQRQDIQESAILLDKRMRLKSIINRDTFMERWKENLEKLLSSTRLIDTRFAAIARWLHVHNEAPLQALEAQLGKFGQPDAELIALIEDYGQRSKDNFFQNKGKEITEIICALLKQLQKEDARYWRDGIECLVERIAMLARRKEGGVQ